MMSCTARKPIAVIFADTSFLYASLVSRDERHAEAISLARRFGDGKLVTTNHVVGECWTLLNRRWGHRSATSFLESVGRSNFVETFHLPEEVEVSAFGWLRQHDEREYSFVDATSFAFMRENRITEALAFDGDFTAAGFVELRA